MGHIKKILLSFLLLTLFVTYQVSITMFTHVHYVNGVMIAHSHPYKGTHSHTASNIIVIAHFRFTSLVMPYPMRERAKVSLTDRKR